MIFHKADGGIIIQYIEDSAKMREGGEEQRRRDTGVQPNGHCGLAHISLLAPAHGAVVLVQYSAL